MGPEAAQIEETLREHVLAKYAGGAGTRALDPDEDLLESGTVDSMGVMELTSFVEESFGVVVDDEDIVPDNFRSLRSMARLVAQKKGIDTTGDGEGESEGEDGYRAGVRALAADAVPGDAVVLVVSRGDEALLDLDGPTAWHFPRDERGEHPGFNPADGAEVISQLEALRSQGATHIVFPETELWWLDEYEGLRDHLESSGGEVARTQAGIVYSL
jgi:acyl carrier protein